MGYFWENSLKNRPNCVVGFFKSSVADLNDYPNLERWCRIRLATKIKRIVRKASVTSFSVGTFTAAKSASRELVTVAEPWLDAKGTAKTISEQNPWLSTVLQGLANAPEFKRVNGPFTEIAVIAAVWLLGKGGSRLTKMKSSSVIRPAASVPTFQVLPSARVELFSVSVRTPSEIE
jgi:hypothetical protein